LFALTSVVKKIIYSYEDQDKDTSWVELFIFHKVIKVGYVKLGLVFLLSIFLSERT